MNGGVKTGLLLSCLTIAGCTSTTREVKVKEIPDPASALLRNGDAVAAANGQLRLGNVGLALEAFRKAQRENPSDPAALAGIGDCYASMGRFDLAQSNYEDALALAPHDPKLLMGIAAIFDREGKPALAMAARAEANIAAQSAPLVKNADRGDSPGVTRAGAKPRVAPPAAQPVRQAARAALPVQLPRPSLGSITVELPKARPADHFKAEAMAADMPPLAPAETRVPPVAAAAPAVQAEQAVAIAKPAVGSITVDLPAPREPDPILADSTPLTATEIPLPPSEMSMASAPMKPRKPIPLVASEALALIADDLSPAKPAAHDEAQGAIPKMPQVEAEAPHTDIAVAARGERRLPEPAPPRPSENAVVAEAVAPRLERLSRGEVALVTTGKPIWRSQGDVQTASAARVRWVALANSPANPNVQILNAARSQGLAASARTVLTDRGWRRLAIGDAPATQRTSVVLYPKGREALGRRVAAQFGVASRMADSGGVVLILGRDAVDRIGRPTRS
jgi:hypothetical protein